MLKRLVFLTVTLAFLTACAFFPADSTALPPPTTQPADSPAETSTPGISPPSATLDPNLPASLLGIPWDSPALFAPGLTPAHQQFASIPGATVYHMALTIHDDLTTISGQAEIRYTNREELPLNEIQLRLYPNILGGKTEITQVKVDDQPSEPTFSLGDSLMTVELPAALNPGQATSLFIEFAVSVPTDANKNYGVLASQDGVLTLAHSYPMVAVYDDDEGWNAEIPSESGDLTYNDASFYVVRVSAPKELALVASGIEISSEEKGETRVVTFALGPARDFMLAATSGYQKFSQQVDDITVNCYVPAKFRAEAESALDTAEAALQIFSERYSPYSYTEFDIIATPTFALGVEYPGLTALAANLFDDRAEGYSAPVQVMRESVLAHEIGHQWFYNMVGNDQLDEPWLDESLTQFITWQYYADRYGVAAAEGFKTSLEDRWARVDYKKIPVGQPVAAYSGVEYSAIVYGRGALFFFDLREAMGKERFNTFLSGYTQDFSWKTTSTAAFKAEAKAACGCNLEEVFAEWID